MDSSAQLPLVAAAAVSTLCIGLVSYMLMKPSKANKTTQKSAAAASSLATTSSASSSSKDRSTTTTNIKDDVWEERRRAGIAPAKTSTSKTVGAVKNGDKPFGSSYYYAHNNSNAKGGYSDGLRMEDFTMNGPRLLSKGGKPVVGGEDENENNDNNSGSTNNSKKVVERQDSTASDSQTDGENYSAVNSNIKRKTLAISKYLWDDPGDKKGVATLRIETLPGRRTSETMEWKDANVVEATAELIGETELLVVVKTKPKEQDADEQPQEYRLHIKQLYGKASSVQAIVKPKRLLVRLQKKKGFMMQLSNIAAWPHPQQKVGQ
jgi:hypothetical protein